MKLFLACCLLQLAVAIDYKATFLEEVSWLKSLVMGQTATTSSRLIVYAQTFRTSKNEPLSLLPLVAHQSGITHVILGTLHLHDKPGVIYLNNASPDDHLYGQLWTEVYILRQNNVKIMALLGGAAGGSWNRLSGSEQEFYSYYHPLADLIKRYHLDGLDIDIEQETDITIPLRLMNALYRDFGPNFIITMTPLSSALASEDGQNLSGFSYFELDELATVPGSETKLVHWYNTMFYGDFPRGPPPYDEVMAAGWDPARVVMVTLTNRDNGSPNGFQKINKLRETVHGFRTAFPWFGGVAGWEYFNAGGSDSQEMEPWEWVKAIGDVVLAQHIPRGS